MQELQNVDRQKLEVLKNKDKDAHDAVCWLRQNQERFEGKVFEPFILSGNVANHCEWYLSGSGWQN